MSPLMRRLKMTDKIDFVFNIKEGDRFYVESINILRQQHN